MPQLTQKVSISTERFFAQKKAKKLAISSGDLYSLVALGTPCTKSFSLPMTLISGAELAD